MGGLGRDNKLKNSKRGEAAELVLIAMAVVLILIAMYAVPRWNVWRQELKGEGLLRRAEQEKQILIEQANAEVEAAKLRSQAIEAIGASIQKYPEYRVQEFIGAFATAMENGDIQKIIYVPTERNIPIVEVGQ